MVKASIRFCLSPSKYLETILGNKPVKTTTDHSFLNRLNTEIQLDWQGEENLNKEKIEKK